MAGYDMCTLSLLLIKVMNNNRNNLNIVEIEINDACNMACSYCPNSIEARPDRALMSLEQVERIFKELKTMDFKGRISPHFYNEPLIHPKLDKIVSLAKKILPECEFVIHTNGSLLTIKKINQLIFAGVDQILVTEHESKQRNFDFFRKLKKSLNTDQLKITKFQTHEDIKLFNRGGILKMLEIK